MLLHMRGHSVGRSVCRLVCLSVAEDSEHATDGDRPCSDIHYFCHCWLLLLIYFFFNDCTYHYDDFKSFVKLLHQFRWT